MTKALIFIPDISGFTEFMTETQVEHSYGIITELIQSILDTNQMKLTTSEIEGDAVLFYRIGEPPEMGELIAQTKKMFVEFHAHLRALEKELGLSEHLRQMASRLTLKFIVHYGELLEVSISKFENIMGSDVILAHRLMKNHIPNDEYLLLSDGYLKTQKPDEHVDSWVHLEPDLEIYENFGKVKIKYIPLYPLRALLPQREEQIVYELEKNPGELERIKTADSVSA
jgi:hypothetical protein